MTYTLYLKSSMNEMILSQELEWRGFINQTTYKNLTELDKKLVTFYHGYDASDDSLTVGNLAAVMMDKCFMRHGHKPVILAGGATSLIGDPGGKDVERALKPADTIRSNIEAVKKQIQILLGADISLVNNLDWYQDMTVMEFLRDIGKHFSMTPLVQRDYIAKRMGHDGAGISYTEFSYTILQGYDFLHLYRKHGATLQLAGSDQWGNSLSGVDLIRRVEGQEVNVLTCPLIINKATGKKFGKSEEGAVWLDPKKTSPFKFYQFWLNVDDEGVEGYLKVFTELNKQQIDDTIDKFKKDPSGRLAQKILAYEVTKLVHGKQIADNQVKIAQTMYQTQDFNTLNQEDFSALEQELPFAEVSEGQSYLDALVSTGLVSSKSEGRRLIEQGAVNSNNLLKVETSEQQINRADCISGYIVLVKGKKHLGLVKLN